MIPPATRATLLLTGASGFVGRHAYGALADGGWHVRCATRDVDDVERLYATFRAPGLAVTLLVMPLVVTCEEIVWRGAVYEALRLRISGVPTVLVGTAAYAAAHVPIGSPALVLAAIGAGLCWNLLRERTNSLMAALVAHLVWDYAVLVAFDVTALG